MKINVTETISMGPKPNKFLNFKIINHLFSRTELFDS